MPQGWYLREVTRLKEDPVRVLLPFTATDIKNRVRKLKKEEEKGAKTSALSSRSSQSFLAAAIENSRARNEVSPVPTQTTQILPSLNR